MRPRLGGRSVGRVWRIRVDLTCIREIRVNALPRLSIGDLSLEWLLDAPLVRARPYGIAHASRWQASDAHLHPLVGVICVASFALVIWPRLIVHSISREHSTSGEFRSAGFRTRIA